MFDLETRREKHLELLEREARLKERNKKTIKFIPKLIRTLGMKRFSEQVMVMVMMILMDLMMMMMVMMMMTPSQAQQPTHAELEHKRRLQQAEDNFFNSLKTDREDRIAAGKPLIYSDAM